MDMSEIALRSCLPPGVPGPVPSCDELLAAAVDPLDPMVLAFAGVIGNAARRASPYDVPIAGLSAGELSALASRFFPRLAFGLPGDGLALASIDKMDEFLDLVELLEANRASDDPAVHWLACAIATAGMEGRHLWQDMGLPSRRELSAVLGAHFPALAGRNTGDMKWKKFFYREMCRRAEVLMCKSPTCGACGDYAKCFGPET